MDIFEAAVAADDGLQAKTGRLFAAAVAIMARLRGPDGCPWDREQSFDSIRKYTLEETYEVLDAIDRRDWTNLKEELGDLLLQVLFYAEMATEAEHFTLDEVVEGLNRKLVRRHPHVFGEASSTVAGNASLQGMETAGIDAGQVLRNWEQIKRGEKAAASGQSEPASLLDSIPRSFPALLEAAKLGSKAAKSGFDWPAVDGVFAKLEEEIAELRAAMLHQEDQDAAASTSKQTGYGESNIEEEVGDLLFTAVNLARHLGVDPELALRRTNRKFRQRFGAMERSAGVALERHGPKQLEALWAKAKAAERSADGGSVE